MPETAALEATESVNIPVNRVDPIKAYKLRYQHGLSLSDIAEHFGVHASAVHRRLQQLSSLVHLPDQRDEYEQVRPSIMTAIEERLLASLVDEEALAKSSLNNRAYAFTQINMARRLEEGKSTANVGILSKMVQEADEKLFNTRTTPQKHKE